MSVKAAPPAVAVLGEIVLIAGDVGGGVVVDLLPLPPHPIPTIRENKKANDDQRRLSTCMSCSQGKDPLYFRRGKGEAAAKHLDHSTNSRA